AGEQVMLLERRARRGEHADGAAAFGAARGAAQRADSRRERVLPRALLPLAADLDTRREQPILAVDAEAAVAVAVRDPGLVDVLVLARHDAPHGAAQDVRIQIRARAIVRRDERPRVHLPRARLIAARPAVERADGAKIDDVAR